MSGDGGNDSGDQGMIKGNDSKRFSYQELNSCYLVHKESRQQASKYTLSTANLYDCFGYVLLSTIVRQNGHLISFTPNPSLTIPQATKPSPIQLIHHVFQPPQSSTPWHPNA